MDFMCSCACSCYNRSLVINMAYISNKKIKMQCDSDFRLLKGIYTAMDKFFLDSIIGFFVPGGGDIITSVMTIPFIFTAVFKLRSVPLALSVIYNALIDVFLGLFPVLGDIVDVFHRSYKKSYYQIVGYVEGDEDIVSEINGNALKTCILLTVLCIVIRLIVLLLAGLFGWFKGLFA